MLEMHQLHTLLLSAYQCQIGNIIFKYAFVPNILNFDFDQFNLIVPKVAKVELRLHFPLICRHQVAIKDSYNS